jgi:chromosome segregation ATPase
MIETLEKSIKLKEDQIKTLTESLELKDQQIRTLDSSLKFKQEKIDTLQKTIEIKNDELDETVEKDLLEKANEEIETLNKKIKILEEELISADEELERLELENQKLRNSISNTKTSKIIDFTNANVPKSVIIERMREILQDAMHNVMITVPLITDLQDLYLYEVRANVNIKVSCQINPGSEEHADLLDEFESLDNISIRSYQGLDRYVAMKDGEELLMAVIGSNENNHLVIHTEDPDHITLLNSLVMDSWLRARKI